jgi:hypothetical protein
MLGPLILLLDKVKFTLCLIKHHAMNVYGNWCRLYSSMHS